MTLKRRLLVLLLAASTLPVVATTVITSVRAGAALRRDADVLLDARADDVAESLERFHRRYLGFAAMVAKLPGSVILLDAAHQNGAPAEHARATVWSLVHADGDVRAMWMLDRSGRVTMTTRTHGWGDDLGGHPLVARVLAGEEAVQAPRLAFAGDRQETLVYGVPARDDRGVIIGAVLVQVRAAALVGALEEAGKRFGDGWSIGVADAGATIIERRGGGEAAPDPFTEAELHERRQLASNGWIVHLAASEAVVMAPQRRMLTESIAMLGIMVPLALIAGLSLAAGVLERTRRLARVAHAVAEGELDVRVRDSGRDELGLVARGFDEMTDAVAAGRRLLEERVVARTRELELVNDRLQERERDLLARKRELARANNVKTMFLANMSHELRTPLNAVIVLSEVLLHEKACPDPRHQQWQRDIHLSGRHLLTLINDILDLAKIEAGHLSLSATPVVPASALGEARSLVEPGARKRSVHIEVVAGAQRAVRADPARLRQVLVNLLSNAIKFSPEGGRVLVESCDEGELVRFAVSDHGPGVSDKLRPRLFQPFVQGERPHVKHHEGTGLGLAICKRLVEAHGGTIRLTEGGPGARFEFTIPVEPAVAVPA